MMLLGWALAFFMVTALYRMVLADRANPNRLSVVSQQSGALELRKNADGHYLVEGTVNGVSATFLIDTGATQVAVSEAIARRAGLGKNQRRRVQTAAGVSDAWTTDIPAMQIGFFTFKDFGGVIVPGLDDGMVLLGMNALDELQITQSAGTMTLRPIAAE